MYHQILELLDDNKENMNDNTYLLLVNKVMEIKNASPCGIITLNVILENIQERIPRRAAYFYRNLCRIIHSAIEDDFENINIPVQFFILSQFENVDLKTVIFRWMVDKLMIADPTLKVASIQRWI
tara:strand:- start:1055 stop:1429 length:375 start_codon:yes stop_codon:yes gene_type:complete